MSPLPRLEDPEIRLNRTALLLFTLGPAAESARKRLAPPGEAAATLALFLEHAHAVGRSLDDVDLVIVSPEPLEAGTLRAVPRLTQRGRGSAESLRLAFDDAFAMGYERVLAMGNDAPELTPGYLRRALAILAAGEGARAVLGPARDGGYALLGLTRPCPEAFETMRWGSSRVARETLACLDRCGFATRSLETLDDIDDARGLARFLARARDGSEAAASLARRIRRVFARLRRACVPTAPSSARIPRPSSSRAPPRAA